MVLVRLKGRNIWHLSTERKLEKPSYKQIAKIECRNWHPQQWYYSVDWLNPEFLPIPKGGRICKHCLRSMEAKYKSRQNAMARIRRRAREDEK